MISEFLIPIASGAAGTAAFAVLYHVKGRYVVLSMLGGAITTMVLVTCLRIFNGNNLISNMAAAFIGGIYCNLCAHRMKAPVPVFMIPTLFPLVPGKSLYFSMISLVQHYKGEFMDNFFTAAEISFGIAVGTMLTTVVCNMILSRNKERHNKI